ncbi:hypothetical protein ACN9MD_02695 [Stenotrophomonas maltophilia]|uniref:hypothetical protein n=1 Tax=Stenotrophomonas maltophilia TaxID=40324 RepID=UPI003CEF686E
MNQSTLRLAVTSLLLLCIPLWLPQNVAAATADTFNMNGLHLGATAAEIRKAFPTASCESSCVGQGAVYLGTSGKFVAFLRDGKATMLAMEFPSMSEGERARVRAELEKIYGPPTDNLGIIGCDEWAMSNGFVAACLNKELNHIVFSNESRVDVNRRHSN